MMIMLRAEDRGAVVADYQVVDQCIGSGGMVDQQHTPVVEGSVLRGSAMWDDTNTKLGPGLLNVEYDDPEATFCSTFFGR